MSPVQYTDEEESDTCTLDLIRCINQAKDAMLDGELDSALSLLNEALVSSTN